MTSFSPREIVSELDRFIVGQQDAKRAVAIALRNRWRRQQLTGPMREEVLPKNILMIGPTGCGKTEIARRLAKLAGAPFLKIEATKFTEVGYVGRDVEQIIRDLVEIGIGLQRDIRRRDVVAKAEVAAEERVLDALVGATASPATRDSFRRKLHAGELAEKEIEIELQGQAGAGMSMFEIPGMPGGQIGAASLGDMLGKAFGNKGKSRRTTVREAYEPLIAEESDKLIDQDRIVSDAIRSVEENGIVFLDEIDKISVREGRSGGDVSREGVQRDLLPLIEGTTVATKHGPVKTDHILFIASGAFHVSKPSDLLPELQGRLPIRVELKPLGEDDFRRILTETEASLIKQYVVLMATEGVTLFFTEDAILAVARAAFAVNSNVENIGARRLQTVLERVLDEISFTATDRSGETVVIDGGMVEQEVGDLSRNADLSRFILYRRRIVRIAVIADIHGNILALDAVLIDIAAQAVDLIVDLGDCVSGPLWPRETFERLKALGAPTVRGNHDRLVGIGKPDEIGPSDAFAQKQLTAEDRAVLAGLPVMREFASGVIGFHATPGNDERYLLDDIVDGRLVRAPLEKIAGRLGRVSAGIVLIGHSHRADMVRLANGTFLINPGSVGDPGYEDPTGRKHVSEAGTPHARYAILDLSGSESMPDVTFRAVSYDFERAARRAEENGRAEWAHALRFGLMPPDILSSGIQPPAG